MQNILTTGDNLFAFFNLKRSKQIKYSSVSKVDFQAERQIQNELARLGKF